MFRDRQHAGEVLGDLLAGYRGQPQTLLLALPRGGVLVAAALARALPLPLDIFPVRKLGPPAHPEFAMAATAPSALVVLPQEPLASPHTPRAPSDDAIT